MKSSLVSALLALLALTVGASLLTACGGGGGSGSGSIDSELARAGTLTVGSDIPSPPFGFPANPPYRGFEIDLVTAIAEYLDLKLKVQDTSIDTIFVDTAQGRFDLAASAATITPQLQQTVNFSDPYYEVELALLVQPGSDISSVEDLAGRTVGTQSGSSGEVYLMTNANAGEVRGYLTVPAAISALKNGKVDATVIEQTVAQSALDEGQTGFEIATAIPTGEYYGLAMAKENTTLLAEVNSILSKIKQDGRLNDLYLKWFKTDVPKGVIDGTTENPGTGS